MSRFAQSLVPLLATGVSLLMQACGQADAQLPVTAVALVRLEGCVVDEYYVPNEGVPVRVTAADGRTLAQATSGRMGEFVVQVPVGLSAAVRVDRHDGETLPAPVLDRDRVVESCLVARHESTTAH